MSNTTTMAQAMQEAQDKRRSPEKKVQAAPMPKSRPQARTQAEAPARAKTPRIARRRAKAPEVAEPTVAPQVAATEEVAAKPVTTLTEWRVVKQVSSNKVLVLGVCERGPVMSAELVGWSKAEGWAETVKDRYVWDPSVPEMNAERTARVSHYAKEAAEMIIAALTKPVRELAEWNVVRSKKDGKIYVVGRTKQDVLVCSTELQERDMENGVGMTERYLYVWDPATARMTDERTAYILEYVNKTL